MNIYFIYDPQINLFMSEQIKINIFFGLLIQLPNKDMEIYY